MKFLIRAFNKHLLITYRRPGILVGIRYIRMCETQPWTLPQGGQAKEEKRKTNEL